MESVSKTTALRLVSNLSSSVKDYHGQQISGRKTDSAIRQHKPRSQRRLSKAMLMITDIILFPRLEDHSAINAALFAVIMVAPVNVLKSRLAQLEECMTRLELIICLLNGKV